MKQSLIVVCGLVGLLGGRTDACAIPQIEDQNDFESGHWNDPAELEAAVAGRLLLEELHCTSCHASASPLAHPRQPAPDLLEVGSRLRAPFLWEFIRNPTRVHPGTRMPRVIEAPTSLDAHKLANAIGVYLVSRASSPPAPVNTSPEQIQRGKELYLSVGCVVCHGTYEVLQEPRPAPAATSGPTPLGHVGYSYKLSGLADFLYEPRKARPAGRMPDMGLSREEASCIAQYLIGGPSNDGPAFELDANLVQEGEREYIKLGCVNCHEPERAPKDTAPPLSALDGSGGCLSPEDTTTPRFELSEEQRAALRVAIQLEQRGPRTYSPREQLDFTLAAFRCTSCHERDGVGGVDPALDVYFQTDEPDLGDHARVPPRLTGTGTKLQPEWMRKVLFDGAAIRPYMHTRMPQFGEENLGHLPELFASLDGSFPFEPREYNGEDRNTARDGARQLLGDKGLACIVCHDFNGIPSPSMRGMDLIDTCDRLQPGWFRAFLIDPQAYRPGIIMPESWSGGIAAHTTILDGDTEAQIQALWYFLKEGRTARNPEGLRPRPSKIEVTDRTRTYRGRSGIAGFRGIAVGFPGGLNYAFNANNGVLSGLWRGEFVSARWDGQGAGDFRPAARATELAQDVAFYRLAGPEDPWPLRPVRGEKDKTNPDPQYPRNRGYRFRGYAFDEDDVPTFMYSSGDVQIEDRIWSHERDGRTLFVRDMRLNAATAQTLWFRALEGEFEVATRQSYVLGKLKLNIPDTPVLIRQTAEEEPRKELLIQLTLPAGETTWSFEYELLP